MINTTRADKISWAIAIVVVNNIIKLTPNFGIAYYATILSVLAIAILNASFKRIDFGMMCLYLSCVLSIIGNNIPVFFRPWERFASFFLISLFMSSFLKSEYLWYIRLKVFCAIQRLLEFVVIGSIIAYLLGQGMGRGGFVGITQQAMLIAPISANVVLTSLYTLHTRESGKRETIYYIVVISSAFLCLLMAASRAAIIATIAASIIYIYRSNKGELGRFTKYIIGTLLTLFVLFPLWAPYLDNVTEKNKGSIAEGGITSSRESHWKQRIIEWESSPIIGIGFASVDTEKSQGSGATFNATTGGVETGTSWLCCLSMTGILGFVSLVCIFAWAAYRASKYERYNKKYAAYITGLVVFWTFHMMAEGYIFAGGSFLFFNVWLLLGVADALYNYDYVLVAITPEEELLEVEENEETIEINE